MQPFDKLIDLLSLFLSICTKVQSFQLKFTLLPRLNLAKNNLFDFIFLPYTPIP
eukprot:c34274_g1_i1 orf=162-323(+)